jgi:dissimilatory sulfite reductase (desulfoviridin) alpha/beta subunit
MINMCNDGNFDEYFKWAAMDSDKLLEWFKNIFTVYQKYKNDPFFHTLNLYRLNKILRNNGVPIYKRELGNKPKTQTKIRVEGLFQTDVKITHCGDLKYIRVGY